MAEHQTTTTAWTVFLTFLKLGLTSFGGPVAHIGYFRDAFVSRHKWIDEEGYADLVALCQFLPGPASSQVGFGLGLMRAGLPGGFAAWLGFTLPSAVLMIALALGLAQFGPAIPVGVLSGLKIAALAVVAHAILGMARTLTPDFARILLAGLTAVFLVNVAMPFEQVVVIALGGVLGFVFFRGQPDGVSRTNEERRAGIWPALALALFGALLIALPIVAELNGSSIIAMIDSYYRTGSLVFGGGHVVLPLLQSEVVATGLVSEDAFLAGYGSAQAVPGPLFTFAAFLGAAQETGPNGLLGGVIALVAIFFPSLLLIYGALPYWQNLRSNQQLRCALMGVNAAVVGLLLAAFWDPIWTSTMHSIGDGAIALAAFAALHWLRISPVAVVAASALAGWGMAWAVV